MLAKQELFEAHLQSILGWLFWRWGLKNYLPRLAFNRDPISDSQVTRITGVTHWHLADLYFFMGRDGEQFFMYLLINCTSSFENCLFSSCAHFCT
jgi:hypothetical protein